MAKFVKLMMRSQLQLLNGFEPSSTRRGLAKHFATQFIHTRWRRPNLVLLANRNDAHRKNDRPNGGIAKVAKLRRNQRGDVEEGAADTAGL